ncbi:pilus assembly protein PilM [Jeotgalibacillus soli]|uniref:Cell division protein n=1 Tax=Jeotgalibacillus soli TaxID=889306 RepID=A0A0C2R0N1_9BACL|nr:pilus assembly protein PilM [Jeotgalibacillus soli]KIL43880.1 cell division protein [Jeotgalibacillus soli]
MDHEKIFALDIGTRSIVGLILSKQEDHFHVEDLIQREHTERSMLDGQIHNVPAVAALITKIKLELEKKHGKLKYVSVAAAGRALKTQQASFELPIAGRPKLTKQDILHMELSAVQQAQSDTAESDEKSHYYHCVGYSVLRYTLDGQAIGSLEDQQSEVAAVEIIATFLPRIVIESLISSLNRAGLEMGALTLEPIAAINVLIPASMRRLNVALVDIGAGTSDIAITNHGTVIAYGMVPFAGDEITECLSDHYLLDFHQAETAKRAVQFSSVITIADILGIETEIPQEEIVEVLSPSVQQLAASISEEILRLNNGSPPKAIMLVGGGSQTPLLPEMLAKELELPPNRVAVRGIDAIQKMTIDESIHQGPELVTPIGIAIAADQSPVNYVTAKVNERDIQLFDVKNLSVGDALITAGIKLSKLYGRPGLAIITTINGKMVTIPGKHGEPPILQKNNTVCTLDDPLLPGDTITIIPGIEGQSSSVAIQDMIEEGLQITVYINDEPVQLTKSLLQNGKPAFPDAKICDRDTIEVQHSYTVDDLCKKYSLINDLQQLRPFMIQLDGKRTFYPQWSGQVKLNGRSLKIENFTTLLKDGDRLTVQQGVVPTAAMLLEQTEKHINLKAEVTFNHKTVKLEDSRYSLRRNNDLLSIDSIIHFEDELTSVQNKTNSYTFQDVFRFVDWELPNVQSGEIIILKNGEKSSLNETIQTGDQLELYIK